MTYKTKFSFGILFVLSILILQSRGVFAAPSLQASSPATGVIQSITLEADTITGVTIVNLDLVNADQVSRSVRVTLETAIAQGFVVLNGDGKPVINPAALGKFVQIDSANIIRTGQENNHPLGNALATFFSEIDGLDYETVMTVHERGVGFGVIAQALWLTTKLDGNVEIFKALIEAKQSGDFRAFVLEDGSTPANWGQLRKAILSKDKQNNVGVVISSSASNGNGSGNGQNHHENGSGNGSQNGNNTDKDSKQDKDKDQDNHKDKKP